MAEGTPGPGLEAASPTGEGIAGPKTPYHFSKELYDPNKTDYIKEETADRWILKDPKTSEEVAWSLKVEGGADADEDEDGGGWAKGLKQAGAALAARENAPPPPEGPRPPEMGDKEWETSPERRRAIIREIYRIEAMDSYQAKYQIVEGLMSSTNDRIYKETELPYLDQLYLDLQDYVDGLKRTRKGGKDWSPGEAYKLDFEPKTISEIKEVIKKRKQAMEESFGKVRRNKKEINQAITSYSESELAQGETEAGFIPEDQVGVEDLPAKSLDELMSDYDNADTQVEQDLAKEGICVYFRQAKRLGILKEVDALLNSVYRDITKVLQASDERKPTDDEIEGLLARGIARALKRGAMEYKENRLRNPELKSYAGVEKIYIELAQRRFEKELAGQAQPDHKDGEYILGIREQPRRGNPRETYWRTGSWPEYYTVIARTPEEFRMATQAFLRMIKNKALGLSPEKLLPHFENFAKALGQAGNAPDVAESVDAKFMEALRQEFEGLAYIYGAWYTNETYNPEKYYQFMMALALHEGPQRMVALARSGDGQVAAFLKMLDADPRSRAYYLSGGSRGQIGNDTISQNVLQDEYMEMLIEEGMGIRLKDYDPYDQNLNADTPEGKEARRIRMLELGRIEQELRIIEEEVRSGMERRQLSADDQKIYNAFANNRSLIGIHMSEDKFRGLYQGFEYDKTKACNSANANIRNWEEFGDIDGRLLPDRLRRSVELGGIQNTLQNIREDILKGKIKLKQGQKAVDLLTPHEKGVYMAAYEQAKANLDIALQIEGALGEKVERGGGVYFVDRNKYASAYEKDYENLEKKEFSDLTRDQKIGRLLVHIRDNKEVFKREESDFYNNEMSLEERADHVDNVPTDEANGFVHCAENKVRILYANASAQVRQEAVDKIRAYAIRQIAENGFDAKLKLPKPVFNAAGEVIGIIEVKFDQKTGNVIGVDENTAENISYREAVDSIWSRSTAHSYYSYQQENRHMLTDPKVVEAAKRIRAGLSKPEDGELLATQLLILDPTLKRVKRLRTDKQGREVIIFDSAVDESNQGHWRIDRELSEAFLPMDDGDANKIRMGYNREDFGGTSRFIIAVKAYIAAHPKRFSRRFAKQLNEIPMHVSSYPKKVGQKGALGLIEMHADEIGDLAGQKLCSQFSITKFVNEMRYGWMMFGALFGYVDEEKGISYEGLYEKPTNNSDKLAKWYKKMNEAKSYPDTENEFFYELMETFGRLDRVLKIMRAKEADTNNTQGAVNTIGKEVFLPDGRFNREIAVETSKDTGASRHSQREFFNAFVDWLKDDGPGGGAKAYPSETRFYREHIDEEYFYFDEKGKKVTEKNKDGSPRRWRDWLFDKMCR